MDEKDAMTIDTEEYEELRAIFEECGLNPFAFSKVFKKPDSPAYEYYCILNDDSISKKNLSKLNEEFYDVRVELTKLGKNLVVFFI